MKTIWSPWRIDHVLRKTDHPEPCIFEPVHETCSNKATLTLFKDQRVVVLLNRFPYTNGHLLVAPKSHVSCITEMTNEESAAVMSMISESIAILTKHLNPNGFNTGCNIGSTAGAGISDHLHFHIVPRWDGDHNFMTVISEIRSIPEHIDLTFDKLEPDFIELLAKKQL